MKKKNPYELEVVSIRLVRDAPLIGGHPITQPEDAVALVGEYLCEFAKNDDRIYCLDSDLAKSLKTLNFAEEFPERFI